MSQYKKRAVARQKPLKVPRKLFLQIIMGIILCALLWVIFAPGAGVMALLDKRSEQKNLERETAQLKQENMDLQRDIERLENDPQYLEEVARRDYGLLKTNERVFQFPDAKKKGKE